jgi:hypothetical protein
MNTRLHPVLLSFVLLCASACRAEEVPPWICEPQVVLRTVPLSDAVIRSADGEGWQRDGLEQVDFSVNAIPKSLPPGYVQSETRAQMGDRRRLRILVPPGALPALVDMKLLWLDAEDANGNKLQAFESEMSGKLELTQIWALAPVPGSAGRGFGDRIEFIRGAVAVRYPIAFTELVFPSFGGACDGVSISRDGDTLYVYVRPSVVFSIFVAEDALAFDVPSAIRLLDERGRVLPYEPVKRDEDQVSLQYRYTVSNELKSIIVYRIDAWEEFVLPFDFGPTPFSGPGPRLNVPVEVEVSPVKGPPLNVPVVIEESPAVP